MKQIRRDREVDADLYSISILEELLDSHKEWQKVQEIVPLTFKAVSDLLAVHSQAIKDIKAVLTTRASKTELTTGLALKSNVLDVTKTVQQLSLALQERPTFTQMNSTLRDYATRTDLTDIMTATQTNRHIARNQQEKENVQITILKTRMDQFQKELTKKVGSCVTLTQFNEIVSILQSKANINQINEVLEQKVSKQYLTAALQKKSNKAQVESQLVKKADVADLQYIVNSLESKVSVNTLDKLTQVLDNKVDKSQLTMYNNQRNMHNRSQLRQQQEDFLQKLQQLKNSFSIEFKQLKRQLSLEMKEGQGLIQIFKKQFDVQFRKSMALIESDITKKNSKLKLQVNEETDSLRMALKGLQDDSANRTKAFSTLVTQLSQRKRGQQNIYSQIDDVRKKLEEALCKAVEKKEFIEFKSEITEMLENKIELEQVQGALDKFESTINIKIAEDHNDYLQQIKNIKDLTSQNIEPISAEIQDIRREISRKQERGELSKTEESIRKVRKQIQQCRKTVDHIYSQVQGKLSLKEYQTDLNELRIRFESIWKDLKLKAYISDVCALADSKPNITDVNTALKEVNQALADKITEIDLQNVIKEQAAINQTFCSENIVGRWMWNSGEVRAGGLIPWESQSANTVPDYFFWQKDKTSILIMIEGVYEVTACVFGKGSTINILANGESVTQNKSDENINTLNRKQLRKKNKQIIGINTTEYLMLPPRSRLSVSSIGESSEGFLNIRRL